MITHQTVPPDDPIYALWKKVQKSDVVNEDFHTAAPRPDEAKEVTGPNMYTASYDEWAAATAQRPDDELARLEREIAEKRARALATCPVYRSNLPLFARHFPDEYRYLELRGLLERHPTEPGLVRVKEQS